MTYDSLDRLIQASGPWQGGNYTYDDVGNRLSKDIDGQNTLYSYGLDNRITNDGTNTIQHDANGNITDDGNYQYVYDSNNRLLEVWSGGLKLVEYKYDGSCVSLHRGAEFLAIHLQVTITGKEAHTGSTPMPKERRPLRNCRLRFGRPAWSGPLS